MVGFRGSGLGFGEGGKKGESLTWSRGFARSGLCCYRVEKEVAELSADRKVENHGQDGHGTSRRGREMPEGPGER